MTLQHHVLHPEGLEVAQREDGTATYGLGLLIQHRKADRLQVALDVDETLAIWPDHPDVSILVRWYSGTQQVTDQLLVVMISDDPGVLKYFRDRMTSAIARTPSASITQDDGHLMDHLAQQRITSSTHGEEGKYDVNARRN